ncbi:uncharacterized protein LOC144713830 isoform X2 [Wolffia australiana]
MAERELGAPIRRLQWRIRRRAAERRRRTAISPVSPLAVDNSSSLIARSENFGLSSGSSCGAALAVGEGERSISTSAPEEGNETENADLDRNPRLDKKRRIPSAEEMEEFFAAAEKQEQLRFLDKYNFDVVRDAPMAGRFLWISAAP